MSHRHYSTDSDNEEDRPKKRARHSSLKAEHNGNGYDHKPDMIPPLSLSILGVEPLDEFIREIADFVHHMIMTRKELVGNVEVEAKVGVLRDKASGQRLQLPVLVETSAYAIIDVLCMKSHAGFQ